MDTQTVITWGRSHDQTCNAFSSLNLEFLIQNNLPSEGGREDGREREGGRPGEGGREAGREREGGRETEGGRPGERGRGGRERDGGREAADVDTTRAPTGLNLSPCQRLG